MQMLGVSGMYGIPESTGVAVPADAVGLGGRVCVVDTSVGVGVRASVTSVGSSVGVGVGSSDGSSVGVANGDGLGGFVVGSSVGVGLGTSDGTSVGDGVTSGTSQLLPSQPTWHFAQIH